MVEGTVSLPFAGTSIYAYGLMVMLGCWLALACLLLLTRKDAKERSAAVLAFALSLPLGFVLARLCYCLLDPRFAPILSLKNILDVSTGGFAMFGAFLGAALAALLAGKKFGIKPARMLDLLAISLCAFLIPARLGEGFTSLGLSRPLTTDWLAGSFLALKDEYDAYLRTYVLEALLSLLLLAVLLRLLSKKPKAGTIFTLFCLLYGLSQTLMESLRYDGHLRFSFVGLQQVLAVVLFSLTLIALAVKLLKKPGRHLLPILALVCLPLVLGGLLGIEFLIDRSELGKLFSYGLYLLTLALPLALGILMLNKEADFGQGRH